MEQALRELLVAILELSQQNRSLLLKLQAIRRVTEKPQSASDALGEIRQIIADPAEQA